MAESKEWAPWSKDPEQLRSGADLADLASAPPHWFKSPRTPRKYRGEKRALTVIVLDKDINYVGLITSLPHCKTKNGNHPNVRCRPGTVQEWVSFLCTWLLPMPTRLSTSRQAPAQWESQSGAAPPLSSLWQWPVPIVAQPASPKLCCCGPGQCHQPFTVLLTNWNFTDELLLYIAIASCQRKGMSLFLPPVQHWG